MVSVIAGLLLSMGQLQSQTIYKYQQKDEEGRNAATLTFFSKSLSQYIPHIVRQYNNGKALHEQIWQLGKRDIQSPFMMLTDWEDDGNGGVSPLPHNNIFISMAPVNQSYYVSPSTERYSHLFKHEYTHTVMTDRPSPRDHGWRSFFGTKVNSDNKSPLSTVWSWLTVPRWYAPRWYHEGIACFMETWLAGGVGRALGGYDEMYFRSMIHDGSKMSTIVGLESEGSTMDFQLGANAYLYGTRFVNYLAMKYGYDKLIAFYNRTPGSHAFFAQQFRQVYGRHIRDVWNEWCDYEKVHQRENIAALAQYPLTQLTPITMESADSISSGKQRKSCAYGSASPMVIDDSLMVAYTAVNFPGDFAHIESIDLRSGKRKKICNIDGPMLYQTAYLTLDRKRQRLIWTDRNGSIRGLRSLNLLTGEKFHEKFLRLSNLAYDNANDRLFALFSHEGVTSIVTYDSSLKDAKVLYTFKFGVSVTDLDVSHNGKLLAMTLVGLHGEQSLIVFNVEDLEDADFNYRTIYKTDDGNIAQCRFTNDDKRLVGTSYYTGVSNIWEVDLNGKGDDAQLLSNVTTGLFAPYLMADGTIYAFEFTRNGMLPVKFQRKVLNDCNAIELLGQKAFEANPQLADVRKLRQSLREVQFGEVYDSITTYRPLREVRFSGAYPDISGFRDNTAWNNVTPVLGYNMAFADPLNLSRLNLSVGISPWSNNDWKNRWHATAELTYWNWTFQASWNKTNFYDLFGPTLRSRKGYNVGAAYDYTNSLQAPFSWRWGASINAYGDMDALPLFQNVALDKGISSFQTLYAYIGARKTRTSLGGTQPEQGYNWQIEGYSYLADGRLFPSLTATLDEGILMPFLRNTSGWLRLAVGQNFGNTASSLAYDYFGGFQNNYVDCGEVYRYRTPNAMPGTDIDAIKAYSYCKATAELNLQPLRFRNLGMLCLYPTYAQLSLFATDLAANPWGNCQFNNYVNVGAQLNIEVVLFNHMKTTWSIGYARMFNQSSSGLKHNTGELLLSLKLL